ncbi:putative oligopeptide ABC transporter permease protein [Oscillibacter valericigenes Sjm18-20]|nr:putative oligopeptide ABC transporter permease protein [Oscillibacter valericigenes Sjm18-20]
MVEPLCVRDEQFRMVGADYRTHIPQVKRRTLRQELKGKPILSLLVFLVIILGCIFAGKLANHDPSGFYLQNLNEAPSAEFRFGTDSLGRDIYSMIWYGGRVSIAIGFLGAAIIAVIGTAYGCISGTANDKVDSVMMRFTEICGSIPSLLFVLILSAVFRTQDVLSISLVIGITGWFGLARIVRSEVRQIRNSEYVLYARCCNGGFFYVMAHHLVPNFISAVMFIIVSFISSCMTTESTLSFLGLGLPVTVISWGSMLSLANKALIMNTWWVIIFPGLFLVVTLMCITNIGSFFRKEVNRKHSNL